jgi:hypothetical protein
MMPGRPQIVGPFATQVFKAGSLQSIQKIVYQSEVDGGEARFSIIEAPKELSFNDQALTEFLNEELSTTKSTLVSKRDITLGGYSGVEFEARTDLNDDRPPQPSFGKLFIVGKRMYVLKLFGFEENNKLLREREKFLNPRLRLLSAL